MIETRIDQGIRNISLWRLLVSALTLSTPISFWIKQGHSSLYFGHLAGERYEGLSTGIFNLRRMALDAGLMYIYT